VTIGRLQFPLSDEIIAEIFKKLLTNGGALDIMFWRSKDSRWSVNPAEDCQSFLD
jgi:hypothetical protein